MAISDARTKQADKDLQKQKQKQNPVHIKKDRYIPWSKSESTKRMNKVDPLKNIFFFNYIALKKARRFT